MCRIYENATLLRPNCAVRIGVRGWANRIKVFRLTNAIIANDNDKQIIKYPNRKPNKKHLIHACASGWHQLKLQSPYNSPENIDKTCANSRVIAISSDSSASEAEREPFFGSLFALCRACIAGRKENGKKVRRFYCTAFVSRKPLSNHHKI